MPTELTRGPWDPAAQHAGPPAALIAHALERCEPREGTQFGRLTLEILGPRAHRSARGVGARGPAGAQVELLEATLSAPEGDVMLARGWRPGDRGVVARPRA